MILSSNFYLYQAWKPEILCNPFPAYTIVIYQKRGARSKKVLFRRFFTYWGCKKVFMWFPTPFKRLYDCGSNYRGFKMGKLDQARLIDGVKVCWELYLVFDDSD